MNISKKETTKMDWFAKIMIVQTLVSAVLVIFLFVSTYYDGEFASLMRSEYLKLMTDDITVDEITDTLNKIKESTDVFSHNLITNSETEVFSNDEEKDDFVFSDEESESVQIGGGEDLQFTSLDTLEGICFDEYNVNFSIIVPLEQYDITSHFGYRISPITGNAGLHTGIDLATGYGTPIYASADGTVIDSAYDNSYGYYVKLQHPDNFITIYAHCSVLCVDEGDTVNQGDVIAKVGSTGSSTGNHLHFEMRKDNIRINPEYVLTDL